MNIEVYLNNGEQHTIVFEKAKEDFFDVLKFNRDSFLQDTDGIYFIVSSIMSFKFKGGTNGKEA